MEPHPLGTKTVLKLEESPQWAKEPILTRRPKGDLVGKEATAVPRAWPKELAIKAGT